MESEDKVQEVLSFLKTNNIEQYCPEIELEILIKKGAMFAPVIIHWVESRYLPKSLRVGKFKELVIGHILSRKLNSYSGNLLRLINPADIDIHFGNAGYTCFIQFFSS